MPGVPHYMVARQFRSAWFKLGASVRVTNPSSPLIGRIGRIEKIVAVTRATVAFPDAAAKTFSRNSLKPSALLSALAKEPRNG